jgi:hypothetical protein
MPRHILSAILLGTVLTAVSYAIETGCSCGPALGLPFTFVHPYVSCSTSSRLVIGADPERNRFGPVLDIESLGYDILIWSAVTFYVAHRYRPRKAQPCAAPNGGPATQLGNSDVTEGPPSVS